MGTLLTSKNNVGMYECAFSETSCYKFEPYESNIAANIDPDFFFIENLSTTI